jgi:hypothetical protein
VRHVEQHRQRGDQRVRDMSALTRQTKVDRAQINVGRLRADVLTLRSFKIDDDAVAIP